MSQVMIIARMQPDHAPAVSEIFARSDATDMPHRIGVVDRSLYRFHELYVHVINFDRPVAEAMALAQQLPAFQTVSDQLRPFISPYAPDWRSPRDAMADRFYTWTSDVGSVDRLRS